MSCESADTPAKRFSNEAELERLAGRAHGGPLKLRDAKTPGLWVRVTASGARTFFLSYRRPGHTSTTDKTLEIHGRKVGTLKDARMAAVTFKASLLSGTDPTLKRDHTVGYLLDEYIRLEQPSQDIAVILNKTIRPTFGRRSAVSIIPHDVTSWHAGITKVVKVKHNGGKVIRTEDVPAPDKADKAATMLARVFAWSMEQRLIPWGPNPAKIEKNHTAEDTERNFPWSAQMQAALGRKLREMEAEAKIAKPSKFWGAPRLRKGNRVIPGLATVYAFWFLILVGVRKEAALTLRWDQIDMEDKLVRWPKKWQAKTKRKPERPITRAVAELLAKCDEIRVTGCAYVFPGEDAKDHLKEIDGVWDGIRKELNLYDPAEYGWARVHDLKHLYSLHVARNAPTEKLGMKLTGHKTERAHRIYARHSLDEIATAAERVADSLETALGD